MSEGPGRGDDGAGVGGGFDVPHLQAVHRRLFDGVDPDAGRLRTVDPPTAPGPGNPPDGQVVVTAVPARHIPAAGGKVLGVLDRAGLRGPAAGAVAAVLAELYVDLRVLRPFQAGNDEAIRVFLGLLAVDAGYRSGSSCRAPCTTPTPPGGRAATGNAARSMPWSTPSARSPTNSGHPTAPPRPAETGTPTPAHPPASPALPHPSGSMPPDPRLSNRGPAGQRRLVSAAVPVLPRRTGVTRSRSRAESSTRIGTNSRVG